LLTLIYPIESISDFLLAIEMNELLSSIESLEANERSGILGLHRVIKSPELNIKMRAILVDWLFEVYKMFKLRYDTIFAAINILDAFICRVTNITRARLQLIGLACLSLAAKYNEIYAPEAADYVFVSDNAYTVTNIREAEKEIFVTLGCNINVPRDIEYLRAISAKSGLSADEHNMSKNLLLTFTIEGSIYLTSVIVTAVTKIITDIYGGNYVNVFHIPDAILNSCVSDIISFCKRLKTSTLKAYTKLYKPTEWLKTFDLISGLTDIVSREEINPRQYLRSEYFKNDISIKLLSKADIPKPSKKLGEGTFGVVKKIEYKGKSYAVKKMRLFDDEITTAGFLREVSVLLSLNHPNIAKLIYITDDLRMIFFDLGISDLKVWLGKEGPMKDEMQLVFAKQMFSALSYMHAQGSLHRDIKPGNIIVFGSNNLPKFVLSDLGSARGPQIALRDNVFTHEVCTLWYRSPELLLGKSSYNDGLDVWSMLCTIYECATGQPLFPGDSEIDQLFRIFQILGTPTSDTWDEALSLPNFQNFPQWQPKLTFFKHNDKLSKCYKELITKSLIMNPDKRLTSHQLYDIVMKYNNGIEGLYDKFLSNMVDKQLNILDRINSLTENVNYTNLNKNDKLLLSEVIKNVLKYSNKIPNLDNIDYYFAFRGFLFLCYVPHYTHDEIISILKHEGASYIAIELASKLILGQIGTK
jgi:serine/threonine protein kinase